MLTKEALTWACNRMGEFYAVQSQGSPQELVAAVKTLRESYGFNDELLSQFDEWVHDFGGEPYTEPMTLGLLIGLMASEFESW